MLDFLRRSAGTWLARLLLGLVAISFVVWGVERRGGGLGGASSLATVGSTAISDAEFTRAYDAQLAELSQRARRRITAEEARTFGVERRVISRLVGETALDNQVKQLGLALSDEALADSLKRDPNYQTVVDGAQVPAHIA